MLCFVLFCFLFEGVYNGVNPVDPDCYNLFNAWTGSGRERWELKVYGSGKVEVRLNNELVDQEEAGACGNITFGYSPTVREKSHTHKHSIFELSFKASQGSFGVQLHDPGPRFGCDVLETEVTTFIGDLTADGCTFQTESTDTFNQRWSELPPIGYYDTTSSTASTTTVTTLTTTI